MRIAGRVERMGTEAAFRVFARARALEAAGKDVIHLEMGEPDFPTPGHVVDSAVAALRAGHTGYAPAAGLPDLRAAIAREVSTSRGIDVGPEQVVVTPGAKAVIFFTYLALVEPGDEVMYPDPGFPIFESMADALGAVKVPYHHGSGSATRPDLVRIERALSPRTRLLVLNSPGNPTGVVHRPEEVARIADLVRGLDLVVLSDEIYGRILYGPRHVSIATERGMAGKTVILDGFSKTWSMTGWRLGWAVAPPDLAPAYVKLMTNSASCAINFGQRAALTAITGSREPTDRMVAAFRERRDALVEGLNRVRGVRCDRPEGSFFAFADVRGTGLDATTLSRRLLEEAGVACVEGPAFGTGGEGFIRFSFAQDVSRIREAVRRMESLLSA